jgi:hypothetical protein
MAHQASLEAGVTRALAIGIRMTPAELSKGRFMRAPDGHASRGDAVEAVTDFITDQFLGGTEEPGPEEDEDPDAAPAEDEDGDPEDPDADPDLNDEDEEDEEAQPEPIPAPVSWDKDAKEAFEQLPRELQATVAEREAQRDKAIQSATTEAANAKRNAVAEANALFADQQRQYASHLEQIAAQLAPQAPDPTLAVTDPTAYVQQLAYFQSQDAQHRQMVQQAEQAKSEAAQRETITRQHELQQEHTILSEKLGDDWTDTGKRKALLTSLEEVGALLGYAPEIQGQANATDILALKAAADWKAKADKYDKLQGTRMAAVRAAKDAPRVSKPGTAATRGERTARTRETAWANVKSSNGKNGDAAAAFLEGIGVKL